MGEFLNFTTFSNSRHINVESDFLSIRVFARIKVKV